ncbi:hypothetical protein [Alteromonas macleodii]|uniref:hypothetical protein n=1 Tax=Alteromonas macleodii TaxID=28108 RepID=UPI0024A7ADE0|nr:hypothetical protein [Alteromonas macleodii]|tara:strand:+ start:373 stop:582 length:210 start_codon:yes stop_codon:yes gene_type:complete
MKPIKYVVLFLLVGLAIFYYEKSFIPLTLDSENRKLGDVLAAYVPLVFVLTWVVYGGYRFFIADKTTGE